MFTEAGTVIEVTAIERKQLPKELLRLLSEFSIADIIAALVPDPIRAESRQYGPLGNVFFRPLIFNGVGSQNAYQGHAHHYDHVTYLSRGTVNLRAWEVEPRTGKQVNDKVIERQYVAPSAILIKRNWAHEFTALEADARADCIFAIRDFDGQVIQEWNGNVDAVT
jgi:hypothetical protein